MTPPLPPTPCPACGYLLDAAMSADLRRVAPRPGDLSVCGRCAEPLVYGPDLQLHTATLTELRRAGVDLVAEVGRIQRLIRARRPFEPH